MAKKTNSDRTALDNARNSLTIVWFVGAALSFILLAAQSILGKFENSLQDVWGWYTPTVFPTSALMLGVIGATALQPGFDKRVVKTFFFKLSRALCAFYLLILLAAVLQATIPIFGMFFAHVTLPDEPLQLPKLLSGERGLRQRVSQRALDPACARYARGMVRRFRSNLHRADQTGD
jgi:hypothetical protein